MLLLGSNSPRRKELIAGLNREFKIVALPDVDESYPSTISSEEVAPYIALLKAKAYAHLLVEDDVLITADTVVCLDDQILGKPADEAEARVMLAQLSGRTHEVITGVTITTQEVQHTFSERTFVTFVALTQQEIDFYVDQYRPLDKAGAYGIQEWIGYVGISRIEGSFYNVMGLPVCRLNQELKKIGR